MDSNVSEKPLIYSQKPLFQFNSCKRKGDVFFVFFSRKLCQEIGDSEKRQKRLESLCLKSLASFLPASHHTFLKAPSLILEVQLPHKYVEAELPIKGFQVKSIPS